ncbi:MAG: lactate racemase domain-containing protein [Gemmataceae bacterium]
MLELEYGRRRLPLDIEPARLVAHHRGPVGLADPAAALREAVRQPFEFPPLRRALTPDDHLAVVIDSRHPALGGLLVALLDELLDAGVAPEGLALIGAEPGVSNDWVDALPDRLEEAHVEEHDAKDRRRLAYLATTRGGQRLYLNRTLVEADQAIVLSTRGYAEGGYAGAESSLYPALGDDPAAAPEGAAEVAWLLGQPFYVQIVPGAGDGVGSVVAGASEAAREAERRLDAAWRVTVPRRADCVVVGLSGEPSRHTFADLAAAASAASKIVTPGGRVILVTEARPALDEAAEVLLRSDDPQAALAALRKANLAGGGAAMAWARAAAHARVSLYSGLPGDVVEELFATPLDGVAQVGRLLAAGGDCVVLEDGHRVLAAVG